MYEFTIILYDGVEIKELLIGAEWDLDQRCDELNDDGDVVWWDYEEI